ncbi:hypothetical protein BCR43DRAFT_316298 [Syncephalastrum racemosum]|uniref:F-box domain-containing protein n=1 Tax=Syncephalastrum racemosum TaxID=13706 RepID=A0A1X2HB72_SYNRA|nr:hypothetical protein BCR43DRAFT_316298 [Syncephalastrum racemosum]
MFSGPSSPTGPHRLRHLRLLGASFSLNELGLLPTLLPDLETLIVQQSSWFDNQDLFSAFMQQCRKLQTVMWADSVDERDDTPASASDPLNAVGTSRFYLGLELHITADMYDFFSRNQRTLDVLQFGRNILSAPIEAPVFRHLSFPQLRCLGIYQGVNQGVFPVANSLQHILSMCPNLEDLTLECIELLLDNDSQAIAGLPRLRNLVIDNCDYVADFLPDLFQRIVSLEYPVADLTIMDNMTSNTLLPGLMLEHLGDMATLRKLYLALDPDHDDISDDHIDAFLRRAQRSGLAQSLQLMDIARSVFLHKPTWIVLLHSVLVGAHIIPTLGSSECIDTF